MKSFSRPTLFMLALFFLASCYPGHPDHNAYPDTALTDHDNTFNFKNKKTYFLQDSLAAIFIDTLSIYKYPYHDSVEKIILNNIHQNLAAKGFMRLDTITSAQEPDLIVTASFIPTNDTIIYAVPSYIGSYYGTIYGKNAPWWGLYYGWGKGWQYYAPFFHSGFSYLSGTLIIDIIDPKGADVQNKFIRVVWRSVLNGFLLNEQNIDDRITQHIDQSFLQSTYLTP